MRVGVGGSSARTEPSSFGIMWKWLLLLFVAVLDYGLIHAVSYNVRNRERKLEETRWAEEMDTRWTEGRFRNAGCWN